MKKLLILTMMFATAVIVVPSVQAKSNTAGATAADPQIRVQIGGQRNRRAYNRRVRTRTITRITQVGRYRYRETVRVTYLPNGRTRSQVIQRVRIGRAW